MMLYLMIFAMSLLVVSIFLPKLLIFIALVPAWWGVMVTVTDPWIQNSGAVVMLYAIIRVVMIHRGEVV